MATTAAESGLMAAEEYGRLPDDGRLTELVRGRIVEMNRPYTSHGYYVFRVTMLLGQFVEQRQLGRVVAGDPGIITERNPDTVRGPGVAYYSFSRIPQGPLPEGYWPASPELIVEIRSEHDHWKDIHKKVGEYLNADVLIVALVDPESKRVHLFSADRETVVLNVGDPLTLPELLPGFEVGVERLFE